MKFELEIFGCRYNLKTVINAQVSCEWNWLLRSISEIKSIFWISRTSNNALLLNISNCSAFFAVLRTAWIISGLQLFCFSMRCVRNTSRTIDVFSSKFVILLYCSNKTPLIYGIRKNKNMHEIILNETSDEK